MKKLYVLLAALAITATANAQTQRLVLVEEFTGETCGPCAAQNPGFNAILNANSTKAISIKYQNNIPSSGPNFYQYNTADIATRTTFYANNYSPHAFIDGNVWNDVAGLMTATMINNRFAVTSPFEIEVSHTLSPAEDTIYTHTVIRATAAVSGNLSARVAVVEHAVYGYTSPNGESDYENVMRKMLPTATGTALPASFAVGDSVVLDLAWKIAASPTTYPGPVPVQLKVISFVQNNTTKEILQAGNDNTLVALDPGIGAVSNVNALVCGSTVTPDVDIENLGVTTLTSVDVQYTLDANPMQTYVWTGSLAQGATATATLPAISITPGTHTLNVTLANPNGLPDQVPQNSSTTFAFGVPIAVTGVTQDFVATTFPPANWVRENPDNGYTWTRVAAGLNTTGSAKMDFYNSNAGNIDILDIAQEIDMTTASGATLVFDVAHRQYSAQYSDVLSVDASTDCGLSWNTVWSKSGATLASVTGYTTSAFTPTTAQWRNEVVDLAAYLGQSNVLLRFHALSDYGNNCYIDNVNVTVTTSVNNPEFDNAISVYPNPAKDVVNVRVNLVDSKNLQFTVTDLSGKQILSANAKGNNFTQRIDVSKISAGTYFLKIESEGKTSVKKITVE